jgi:glycosyltransferase involved in cell wall biosynthesis
MTNVLFINYWSFDSNSSTHIFNLANRLVGYGVNCAVAVPRDKITIQTLGEAKFTPCEFDELNAGASPFLDGRKPDLLHAWTPRELVRRQTETLARRHGCPYVVHLEDNEEFIFQAVRGIAPARARTMSIEELDQRTGENLSHPVRYRRFLEGAAGVTAIIDTLFAFAPENLPKEEIRPGYDEDLFFPQKADCAVKKALGIEDSDYVLAYTGNTHAANAPEMRSLYSAIGLVNRQGHPLKLVRCGRDDLDFLGDGLEFIKRHIIDVGFRPHTEIPGYLALADFLVQPGRADEFNNFRIPSKLPEFLAMGRPVVLPKTNIGRQMRHEVDGLVMEEGHNLDIARQIHRLIRDPGLCERLGFGARKFAEKHLNWNTSAEKLLGFYDRVLGRTVIGSRLARYDIRPKTTSPMTGVGLSSLHGRYADYPVLGLGYATVADYVDSLEFLPDLAQINHDIKDVQRPWMLKALLARVPPGGRLLEIGGGDPFVASRLVGLGYHVSIVDPYEGDDRGPADFERICQAHPQVTFIRGRFPEAVSPALAGSFDAIYSISVLEHVPIAGIGPLFAGIKRFLRNDGCPTIHAIDHVYKGRGSDGHVAMLQGVVEAVGLRRSLLDEMLRCLDDDPDVYFLSAEAHNRWRGSAPYAEFPMRRVVSVNLCALGHSIRGDASEVQATSHDEVKAGSRSTLRAHPAWDQLEPLLLEFFDPVWYGSRYPDLDIDGIDLFDHFVVHGAKEERNPCADFDTCFYLQNYPDAAGNGYPPIVHYLLYGRSQGRIPRIFHVQDLDIKADYQLASTGIIFPRKICVLLHLYYIEMFDELASYIENIEFETDVVINLVDTTWAPELYHEIFNHFPEARVIISPDQGRDIGGFSRLLSFVDFRRYDLFLFIHSKRSPQLFEYQGRRWRQGLLDPIVGSPAVASARIEGMRANPRIGITAGKAWRDTGVLLNAKKYDELLDAARISPEARDCEFVAGTMFFTRTEVAKRLCGVLSELHFEDGHDKDLDFHLDGQYAHAVERLIGNLVKDEGLIFWWV